MTTEKAALRTLKIQHQETNMTTRNGAKNAEILVTEDRQKT